MPTPKAHKETIICQPSQDVLRLNTVIQERADRIYNKMVDSKTDNMLKITSDGKKLALDPRCFDPDASDDEGNKINLAVQNIHKIWKETEQDRLTQLVFCDLSVPKIDYVDYKPEIDFDIYNDIKFKLVLRGIPEHEVKFIHEANTDLRKQVLFDDVKQGKVRILLGSTEKCDAGTNIQDRLYALHHLDTPYRPSDLAQREGRIIRQGNLNKEVWIYTYVTERTFNSYSYQILENKQKFIAQIDRGDLTIREASDIDETTLSYAEIKAITTANPKIKRKMELEQEISRLRTIESEYRFNKYRLQDKINSELPRRIKSTEIEIENLQSDIHRRQREDYSDVSLMSNTKGGYAGPNKAFSIQLGNKIYADRKEAGELFLAVIQSEKYNEKIIGRLNGFDIIPVPGICSVSGNRSVLIRGDGSYKVEISMDTVGSIVRLENFFKSLEKELEVSKTRLTSLTSELTTAKIEVVKEFEYAEKLSVMSAELASLDAKLDLNKQDLAEVVINDQFADEIVSAHIEEI